MHGPLHDRRHTRRCRLKKDGHRKIISFPVRRAPASKDYLQATERPVGPKGLALQALQAEPGGRPIRPGVESRGKRLSTQHDSTWRRSVGHFCLTRLEEVRQTWRDEPEASSQDHFNQKMIGVARNPKTYAQVKLPVRAK